MTNKTITAPIKQFKLSNDDEIICEVLEWSTDESSAMIVRGVVRIIVMEDFKRGVRLFAFRPWMGFADDPTVLQTINSMHILAEITPTKDLLKQYSKTITHLKKKMMKKNMPMDQLVADSENMSDEEFESMLDNMAYEARTNTGDSASSSNIIKFRPKRTLH